jgi:hypothetical protein
MLPFPEITRKLRPVPSVNLHCEFAERPRNAAWQINRAMRLHRHFPSWPSTIPNPPVE